MRTWKSSVKTDGDFSRLPDVSVIVLTYGNFTQLDLTLQSIQEQTCRPTAVVVSDDGSGIPFPLDIVVAFPSVQFRQNPYNIGTVAHMNAAARQEGTSYLKFLSAGDAFSDPTALGALVKFAVEQKTLAVTSQVVMCSQDLQRQMYCFPGRRRSKYFSCTPIELFSTLAATNLVSASGTLFSKSFFSKWGGFDEDYRLLEDWPAWLRLTREGEKLPLLNRVTCLYGAGGISSAKLDAYHAPALRQDMRHCYEKEIMPYLDFLCRRTVKHVQYNYDRLCGIPNYVLWKNYFWQSLRIAIKHAVKKLLFSLYKA